MDHTVLVELIKLIPSLVWAGIVIGSIIAFYHPIRWLIDKLTVLKFSGLEFNFVKEELDKVAREVPAGTEQTRSQVARRAARLHEISQGSRILLVDDHPEEMTHVTDILMLLGIRVEIARSTSEALEMLTRSSFDLVISDMRRGESENEGISLLREMRGRKLYHPMLFAVGRYDPDRGTPAYAIGITNRIDEILNYVFDALERVRG